MANFVLVVSGVPISGFNQIMNIVAGSGGQIKFHPSGVQGGTYSVNSAGMTGPDDKSFYNLIRLEFDDKAVDKAGEILKILTGVVSKS